MAKIKQDKLAEVLQKELTLYHTDIVSAVDELSNAAVKRLVKLAKRTAPQGARKSYKKHIASKRLRKDSNGSTYVWYVKPPDHRLTHLLVHGHATKDGGRTKADPFLRKAVDEVLPDYEQAVEEAISK